MYAEEHGGPGPAVIEPDQGSPCVADDAGSDVQQRVTQPARLSDRELVVLDQRLEAGEQQVDDLLFLVTGDGVELDGVELGLSVLRIQQPGSFELPELEAAGVELGRELTQSS